MPRGTCVIALDVGGTTIKAGLADLQGNFIYRARRSTRRSSGVDVVVANLLDVAQELASVANEMTYDVAAAGVVVPGMVDEARGVAVDSSNIGWRDVPLRALLTDRLGIPVHLGHDVRAGALAEGRRGAAQGRRNFAFIPIGTGIGGAWVVDGSPYTGATYAAAEVGHIIVRPAAELCACGRVGCLETVASASAIVRRYEARSGSTVSGAVDVAARVRAGDPHAVGVWDEALDALADALAIVGTLLDPEIILLGGGLAEAAELLSAPLRRRLAERSLTGSRPELVHASLGDEAGCVGAALYGLDLIGTTSEGTGS